MSTALRAVALHRKNSLFAESGDGDDHAVAIYSLVDTVKLNPTYGACCDDA